jgi:cytochrome oxidase Cu insertion factor (SCO1/SenC/PrrC family)
MRRARTWLPVAAILLLIGCQAVSRLAPAGAPAAATGPTRELRVGDKAPDFALLDQNRQTVTLSQFRGRPVQLAFYVWAFSGG